MKGCLLNIANCFAGGIFLGAGLVHMLPDASKCWQSYIANSHWDNTFTDFPFSHAIAGLSLFILFCFEHLLAGSMHNHSPSTADPSSSLISDRHIEGKEGDDSFNFTKRRKKGCIQHHSTLDLKMLKGSKTLVAYLLAIVLSIHSFFTGAAVGIVNTSEEALILTFAVCAHKGVEALALGISFTVAEIKLSTFLKIFVIYALMTPMGIVLGILVAYLLQGNVYLLISGIIQSISAGSFIYVSLLDILADEFKKTEHKNLKISSAFLGLIFMTIIGIWV